MRVYVRPLLVTRFANTAPGAAVLLFGVVVAVGVSDPFGPSLVVWAVTGVGVVLIVRSFRAGVRVNDHSVTVYGYVWSRTIRRRSMIDLTTFPALRWTSRSGRSHWTPLLMFMTSGRALAFINAHHENCQQLLQRELVKGRSA